MRLRQRVEYVAFLKKARECAGEVCYKTQDGDCLNLKSLLSEYVFLSAALSNLIRDGIIHCDNNDDYELLGEFLEAGA